MTGHLTPDEEVYERRFHATHILREPDCTGCKMLRTIEALRRELDTRTGIPPGENA